METSVHAGFFTWTREAQIVLHPDGAVVAWNPAAARLLRIPTDDAIGSRLTELVPELADLLTNAIPVPLSAEPDQHRRTLVLRDKTEVVVDAAVTRDVGVLRLILADASALVAAERQAQSIDLHYRSLLDALPIGFTVVSLRDERYPTLYQNDWGIEVSGWGNHEWERDPDFSLKILHPDDREAMLAFRIAFREALGPFDVEYRVVRPDGGVVWLRDWGTVVHDAHGVPDHLVVCLLDVTAQKHAELALREALDDLSAAHAEVGALSQAKSEYLSFLSHELRTPLTSIQGFSELMAEGGLPDDETAEFAGIIHLNAQRLERMISDILDMDRLESGQRHLRRQRVDLAAVILEVVETLSGLGHDHDISLAVAGDLPPLGADGDLLTIVFTNVIGNAIKYTPPAGRIAIAVSQPVPTQVEIAVSDTGPGVPPEALEKIFQRFARLTRDERQLIVGSGLGLPIARQIVELHGGQIWAENVDGGARFVVRLPVERSTAPCHTPEERR
ncbi:MAG: ATP-binding protein [Thermomicrobiales bacterium]